MKDAVFALAWLAAFGLTLSYGWLVHRWIEPYYQRELTTKRMLILGSLFGLVGFFVMAGMLTIVRTFFPLW